MQCVEVFWGQAVTIIIIKERENADRLTDFTSAWETKLREQKKGSFMPKEVYIAQTVKLGFQRNSTIIT